MIDTNARKREFAGAVNEQSHTMILNQGSAFYVPFGWQVIFAPLAKNIAHVFSVIVRPVLDKESAANAAADVKQAVVNYNKVKLLEHQNSAPWSEFKPSLDIFLDSL